MSFDLAVRLESAAKSYRIYDKPSDRLQAMFPWNRNREIGRVFHALKPLSLDIGKGEVIGIVGRNGAGKSTLLQIIAQTLPPSSGKAETYGTVAALLELGSGFNPEFSGRENVYLAAAIAGLSEHEAQERYEQIVEFSGVGEFIDQPIKNYSSGMTVRLAFAVATSVEPDILIVDEALSVGDGAFARKSFDRIMELKSKGCTILFCSHNMHQIEMICSRALWIDRGELQHIGTPSDVINHYNAFLNGGELQNSDTSLPAQTTGDTKITGVTFTCDGVETVQPKLLSGESDLQVRIDFESSPDLPSPTVSITFDTADLRMATSLTSYGELEIPRTPEGKGSIRVTFPRIPLLRGKYYLSVYLMCERCIHTYDAMPHLFVLEVEQTSFEQGIFKIERQWSL